ncbi:Ribonuclease P protein subunit rpr2 [Babesia sp. Xinjiang]|uniref:Ribonuclease P protein subunit rpr2 n=1 Tax=Babesia sp. Xinjiang TaxID=462227 RepID=UPI000A253B9C|nr:Ribonuclease P protein subunit rpr2 [Babesia sp. Xinjiang]ORM41989.1 Ribonuclease P protein subunit rpr2 [Babesia sp. Xinjiang]
MKKKNKPVVSAGKDGDKLEAAKATYANDIHVKRLGFLLDAAELMGNLYPNISRGYVKELREIAQKHVIRLDPSFKRAFCKGCNTLLLPGVNAVIMAECHGREWRHVPENIGERELIHDGNLADPHPTEIDALQPLDESTYDWMSVTCCICTRTRRTKVENINLKQSCNAQEVASTEPEMQLF